MRHVFAVLAALLALTWVFCVGVAHIRGAAIHVLLALAIVSAVVQTIRPRRTPEPPDVIPKNAVK